MTITWAAVAFLVYQWRGDKSMSISKHAAAHKSAYLMMLIVESLVLPMFFLFIAFWLVPTFDLHILLSFLVGLASTGLLIAAWIPDITGWKGKVHGLSAYGAAMLFVPASTVLFLSPNISVFARNMALFVLMYEVVAVTCFTVFEKVKSYHLYAQGAYILLFDLSILAAAYIR